MGTAVPVRRKDLPFDRRVCYHGKAGLCTGDIFPWIPGDYKTAPRTSRSLPLLAMAPRFLCSPEVGAGLVGTPVQYSVSEANPEFLISGAPRGKESAQSAGETWPPAAFAGFAALEEPSREL